MRLLLSGNTLKLLLTALLSSACGQPSAETRAVTDGRLTLKMQQFQGTGSYKLVACRGDRICQNVLLTYDNKEVVFRDGDQLADNEVSLRRLVPAKTATEKSGGSILSDTVSMATAFVIGAGGLYAIYRVLFRGVKGIIKEEDRASLAIKLGNRVRIWGNLTKKGRPYMREEYLDEHDKRWILKNINWRGLATLIDGEGKKNKVAVRKWPGPMEYLEAGYLVGGGTIGANLLYLKQTDRSAMLADRMTADNWQAIFSRDPTVKVKIKKDIKHIVYSLAQTFDLKINTAALQ